MVAYFQPPTLDHALALLSRDPGLVVLAGGTDIYPAKVARAGWGQMSHPNVLDISRVGGLRGIENRADHWWIGALTTWTEIAKTNVLPPLFDGLRAAAREVGGVQIQNRGTIGGNICTASPAGDSIPCLLTLDAEVVLASLAGVRVVPLASFLVGYRKTALSPGEIVEAIMIKKRNGDGYFLKLGARRYLVISIAMVAATIEIESGTDPASSYGVGKAPIDHARKAGALSRQSLIRSARVAVGSCSATAQRLPELERDVIGRPIDSVRIGEHHLAHLMPIDDVRASADYRRSAALQLVRDVFANAVQRAAL